MAAVNIIPPPISWTIQVAGDNLASLPDDFNSYSRFETDDSTQLKATISLLKPTHSDLTFNTEDVVKALKKTKAAPGPHNISGRTLRYYAEPLGVVVQLLFQSSHSYSTVPKLWKHSTVIPIPKKGDTIKALNDLCPVAFTSLVMKTMEKIIER